MAKLVEASWVHERLGSPEHRIIDPRRPMKYLSGHLPGAVNVPVYKAFASDGQLLEPPALAEFVGAAGIGDGLTPVIYDSPEGQNAAMLSWLLEYLGVRDVAIMDVFYETWKESGREVRYRPVELAPARFTPRSNPAIRATLSEVSEARDARLVDFRSADEFSGERVIGDDPPGHIPGAVNVVWRDLGEPPKRLLRNSAEIRSLFARVGIKPGIDVIAYCRSGPRAALGFLALRQAGIQARLFDGSYARWAKSGLPVEK